MKLEELQRRQSEVIQTGPQPRSNDIPERQMPESKDAAAAAAASDRGALSKQRLEADLERAAFQIREVL